MIVNSRINCCRLGLPMVDNGIDWLLHAVL